MNKEEAEKIVKETIEYDNNNYDWNNRKVYF